MGSSGRSKLGAALAFAALPAALSFVLVAPLDGARGQGADICAEQRADRGSRICPLQELRVGGTPLALGFAYLAPEGFSTRLPNIVVGRTSGTARIYRPRTGDEVDYFGFATLDGGFDQLDAMGVFDSGRPRPQDSVIPASRTAPETVLLLGRDNGVGRLAIFNRVGPPSTVFGLGRKSEGASPATADLDHDGLADVLISVPTERRVRVFLANDAGYAETTSRSLSTTRIASIRAADFNGDGNVDLAALARDDRILFAAGDGAGGFGKARVVFKDSGFDLTAEAAVGDFDDDGAADDLAASGANDVLALTWRADGTPEQTISRGLGGLGGVVAQEISDDGIEDLIGQTGEILIGRGGGRFELAGGQLARALAGRPAMSAPNFIALDEDELLDAVLLTSDKRLTLYLSNPKEVEGPPRRGDQILARPLAGRVLVSAPGELTFRELTGEEEALPIGTIFDTTRGRVRITADGPAGRRTAIFEDGVFIAQQRDNGDDELTAELAADLSCDPADLAQTALAKKSKRKSRQELYSRSNEGGTGSRTKHGRASDRGTEWRTVETCTGTRFTLIEGSIEVTDFGDGESRVLRRPGDSFFATGR